MMPDNKGLMTILSQHEVTAIDNYHEIDTSTNIYTTFSANPYHTYSKEVVEQCLNDAINNTHEFVNDPQYKVPFTLIYRYWEKVPSKLQKKFKKSLRKSWNIQSKKRELIPKNKKISFTRALCTLVTGEGKNEEYNGSAPGFVFESKKFGTVAIYAPGFELRDED